MFWRWGQAAHESGPLVVYRRQLARYAMDSWSREAVWWLVAVLWLVAAAMTVELVAAEAGDSVVVGGAVGMIPARSAAVRSPACSA